MKANSYESFEFDIYAPEYSSDSNEPINLLQHKDISNPLLTGFSEETDSLSLNSLKFNNEYLADSIENIQDFNLIYQQDVINQ